MAFQVSLILTADGEVAATEVRKVGAAVKEAGAESEKLGTQGRSAAAGVKTMGQAADLAEDQVKKLAAADREAALRAKELEREKRRAAGATGNLIAQFNDIGVMMMAGQNPLQLAVQQGTQITQVIGPMGAAGAVKSLGGALVGMLSPINLVTIGSIAAGAAMMNWLTGSKEEALSLKDMIAATRDELKAFDEAQKAAGMSAKDMVDKFGTADPVLKSILADMTALQKIDLYRSLAGQATAVRDLVLDLSFYDDRSSQSAAQDFLGLSSMRASAREAGAEFANNLEILSRSEEPAVKLRAALDLRQQLLDTAGGLNNLNEKQEVFYQGLAATIRDLILIGAKVDQAGAAPNENMKALSALWREVSASASDYIKIRLKEDGAARSLLVGLREQAAIQDAVLRFGADSLIVAKLRQQAERRVHEEHVNSLNVSAALKSELMAAYDANQKLANVDVAAGISAAANEARRVADELTRAVGASVALSSQGGLSLRESEIRLQFADDPVATAGALARERMRRAQGERRTGAGSSAEVAALDAEVEAYARNIEQIERNNQARLELLRNQRSGTRAHEAETEAVIRLIMQEQEQLDLLRETDPVQKEMIRNREALAGATDAERRAVEELIAQRIAEQEAMEGLQEREEFFNRTLYDAFDGLLLQGESLEDVIGNIGRALAQAALQAAILGEGPLAKLFGWTTPLFSFSSGGEIPALASGGQIYGPGGGADDKVLMWGSSGEFMMNAKATARHRHQLEAMNAGNWLPGFAQGGSIDGSTAGAAGVGGMAHLKLELSDDLKARILTQAANLSVEISQSHITDYDRALPRRVRAINDDPGRIG